MRKEITEFAITCLSKEKKKRKKMFHKQDVLRNAGFLGEQSGTVRKGWIAFPVRRRNQSANTMYVRVNYFFPVACTVFPGNRIRAARFPFATMSIRSMRSCVPRDLGSTHVLREQPSSRFSSRLTVPRGSRRVLRFTSKHTRCNTIGQVAVPHCCLFLFVPRVLRYSVPDSLFVLLCSAESIVS